MELDGKSFLTSVGTQDSTVWIHDKTGEHQMSSEGDSYSGEFSDGKKFLFLKRSGQAEEAELWSTELEGGTNERVVPGYGIEGHFVVANFAVTRDGQRVVLAKKDEKGISHLWVAATDHRTSPVELESRENEDSPHFLPNGDLIYRAVENGKNYLYTRKQDGSGRRKLREQPVLEIASVSPDGRWTMVAQRDDTNPEHPYQVVALPNAGGETVLFCGTLCMAGWSTDGKYMHLELGLTRSTRTYVFAVKSNGLSGIPPGGFVGPENVQTAGKSIVLPVAVDSMADPEKYAYTQSNVRRNIYRVPIP